MKLPYPATPFTSLSKKMLSRAREGVCVSEFSGPSWDQGAGGSDQGHVLYYVALIAGLC
jgi:hypothetical protein